MSVLSENLTDIALVFKCSLEPIRTMLGSTDEAESGRNEQAGNGNPAQLLSTAIFDHALNPTSILHHEPTFIAL